LIRKLQSIFIAVTELWMGYSLLVTPLAIAIVSQGRLAPIVRALMIPRISSQVFSGLLSFCIVYSFGEYSILNCVFYPILKVFAVEMERY